MHFDSRTGRLKDRKTETEVGDEDRQGDGGEETEARRLCHLGDVGEQSVGTLKISSRCSQRNPPQ